MILDASGRALRRSIGFHPEYRVERAPFEGLELVEPLELVDALGSDEIELDGDALETCSHLDPRYF